MVIYLHLVDFYGKCRYSKYSLVGGFFFSTPSEKYAGQIGSWNPKDRVKIKEILEVSPPTTPHFWGKTSTIHLTYKRMIFFSSKTSPSGQMEQYFTNLDFSEIAGVPFPFQFATFWGEVFCEVDIIWPETLIFRGSVILFNGRIVGSLLCDKKNDDILARTFNGSKGHSSEAVDTLVAVVMANVQTSLAQVQRPPLLLDSGPLWGKATHGNLFRWLWLFDPYNIYKLNEFKT